MKKIIAYTLTLILVVMTFAGCGKSDDSQKTAITNGVIYTVEGENWDTEPAEAMVVDEDGIIEFVGSDKDAEEYIDDNTNVIDLEGNLVLPGFIDGHVHPPGNMLTKLYDINLFSTFNKDAALKVIEEFVKENPDEEIYWGRGFSMGMVDANGNPPSKEWLDEICPDTPMILQSSDAHSRLLNSAALKLCGIDANTTHPTGNIHKDANGEPTGLLTDASDLITVKHEYTQEQQQESLVAFLDLMHEWGYTGFWSAGAKIDKNEFLTLDEKGEYTMHTVLSGPVEQETWKEDIENLKGMRETFKESSNINVQTAKVFEDGVIEGSTAYLKEPYTEAAGKGANYVSTPLWDQDTLTQAMTELMKNGFDVHVHAVGDAAIEETVNSMEVAQKANGDQDYRNAITHLQIVDKKEIERMGELGIIGVTQPFWHIKLPGWYDTVEEQVLGKERAWNEYPLKSLIDNGVLITASGDFPVSVNDNPFGAIEVGVTRNLDDPAAFEVDELSSMDDPAWLLNPAERITVKQMIEAYTINGAYQMRGEDSFGSLKVGKSGDFIIIGQDIFNVDPIKLNETEVLATFFAGKQVSGEFGK